MAALLAELRVGLSPFFRRSGILPLRGLASKANGGKDSSSNPPKPKSTRKKKAVKQEQTVVEQVDTPEPFDNSKYQNEEYFSYKETSFYDIEVEIDGTGNRQAQPETSKPYEHTAPWKKEAAK